MKDYYLLANTIIDRYANLLFEKNGTSSGAILCAISDVEGKIALLNEMLGMNLHNDFDILMRRGEYIEILQELKNMN